MKIQTKINRVAFSKESGSGFWMIILTETGTFKGTMASEPKEGDEYEFNGNWTVYNGKKEFKFIGAMPVIPDDNEALLLYVCKNAKGIGDSLRSAIWEAYGNDWPEQFKTGTIKGLTDKRIESLIEALEEAKLNETQVKVLSYLMQKGCSETLAYKCWNKWKNETIAKLEEDCFYMTDLFMVSFATIDGDIANNFGIKFEDPRRIKAGIMYAYKQVTNDGKTVVDLRDLANACNETLKINFKMIYEALQIMLDSHVFKLFSYAETYFFSLWKDYAVELEISTYMEENA